MSNEALRRARHVAAPITGTQHHVLFVLADHANEMMDAWPSQSTLAAICHRPRSVIQSALSALEQLDLIERCGRVGSVVRYRLCLPQPHAPIEDLPDRPPVRPTKATRPPTGHGVTAHRSGVSVEQHRPPVTTRPPTGHGVTAHRSAPDRPPVTEASGSISEASLNLQQQQLDRIEELRRRHEAHEQLVARWCQGVGLDRGSAPAEVGLRLKQAIIDHGLETARAAVERALGLHHPSLQMVMRICAEGVFGRQAPDHRESPAAEQPCVGRGTAQPPDPPPCRTETWERVLDSLREQLNADVWRTYFEPLSSRDEQGELVLEAPTEFLAEWLRENYASILTAEVQAVIGEALAVTVEVAA